MVPPLLHHRLISAKYGLAAPQAPSDGMTPTSPYSGDGSSEMT